jgi:hypothetical protein
MTLLGLSARKLTILVIDLFKDTTNNSIPLAYISSKRKAESRFRPGLIGARSADVSLSVQSPEKSFALS